MFQFCLLSVFRFYKGAQRKTVSYPTSELFIQHFVLGKINSHVFNQHILPAHLALEITFLAIEHIFTCPNYKYTCPTPVEQRYISFNQFKKANIYATNLTFDLSSWKSVNELMNACA